MRWAGNVARMGRGKVHTGFWWGDLKERRHLEDPCIDGRIILNGQARIRLDRWCSFANAVINLQVPQNAGNFLTSWEPFRFSRLTLLPWGRWIALCNKCCACAKKFGYTDFIWGRRGGQFLFSPYHNCGTIIKRWILSKCILEYINDYAWL